MSGDTFNLISVVAKWSIRRIQQFTRAKEIKEELMKKEEEEEENFDT